MRHTISIAIMLSIIWLINSGHYSPLFLVFGAVSVAFVIWFAHRMDVIDDESQPIHLSAELPLYYGWLIKKIVVANIDVARRAWQVKPSISPSIQNIPVSQKTDMGRVIFANSINLTPGTLSVELNNEQVLVHSLTYEAMQELVEGEMGRRVSKIE
ncbi:MAG: Na+/H+ antiporter subunit E [Gammaproteobacteria bacterium]|nr:Na+/H+ antiporter subunit E [Gammaproteobacteria bacterium]